MRVKKFVLLIFFSFLLTITYSQTTPKKLAATKISSPVKIDGNLNEPAWKTTIPANDFIEYRPNPGGKETHSNRTEIFILYDNTSI